MARFLVKRCLHIALIFFLLINIIFFIMQITPGTAADRFLAHPNMSREMVENIKERFGLNQPWYVQYYRYLRNVFTGNLGISLSQYPTPVWDIIIQRLPRTFVLFFTARIISFYLGFFLGKIIAWKRNSFLDTGTTIIGISFWTMFYPLLAIMNIWFFAYVLEWFPISGFVDPYLWLQAPASINANLIFSYLILTGLIIVILWLLAWLLAQKFNLSIKTKKNIVYFCPLILILLAILLWSFSAYGVYIWNIIYHLALPVFTLALISFGGTMLLTRDSMLDNIQADYVMVAKAKGLKDKDVRDKYVARMALLPVVTSLTLSIGFVFSGGVVTETLFSWPGLGHTLLQAALLQDVPLAMGAFAFSGIFILIAHFLVDLLYVFLDPRVSLTNS